MCALGLIMLVSFFFRFHELGTVPPGLLPDIAINGLDALKSLQTGDFKVFYPDNYGREGLMIWLDAASIAVFGANTLALRIPAAVFGTLTVLGIYLFSWQLFKEKIALLAAFFCSVSFWHVNFSRLGFRSILVPFFIVFSMLFLWRAFEEKSQWMGIISGAFFGLGFYTYPSFRFAVLLLLGVLALWFIALEQEKREFIKISLAMLLTSSLISLPIEIYFWLHPADLLERAEQVWVFSTPNPLFYFAKSIILHLAMFNIRGDPNWTHNVAGAPELFWPIGILFLIGLFISLRVIQKKNKMSYIMLFMWLFFLLLPGALTFEGIPHSQRVIGVIPPVMIFSAIGGVAAYDWLKSQLPKRTATAIIILFIAIIAFHGYHQYFITWANNPDVQGITAGFVNAGKLTSQLHHQGVQTILVANIEAVAVPYPDCNGLFLELLPTKETRRLQPHIRLLPLVRAGLEVDPVVATEACPSPMTKNYTS